MYMNDRFGFIKEDGLSDVSYALILRFYSVHLQLRVNNLSVSTSVN